jgi:hypothetical protein
MSNDPRYIHRVLVIDDDTYEERQAARAQVGANLATVLEYVIQGALIKKTPPHPSLFAWERFQREHITRHMRKPQNMKLVEAERLMGGRIDRLSLACCNVVRAWEDLIKYRNSKAYRKHQEAKHQEERKRKLAERRKRKEERMAGVVPRTETKKQVEHEERERCSKCGKRPAVRDHLCGPCLDWERAKLGRE